MPAEGLVVDLPDFLPAALLLPSSTRRPATESGQRSSRRAARALDQDTERIATPPWGGSVAGPDEHANLLDGVGIRVRPTPQRVRAREHRYRVSLLVADLLSGLLALEVTVSFVGTASPMRAAFVALPLIVLLAKLQGLYDRDDLLVRKTTIEEVPRLFQHATFATLVLVLVDEPLGIGQLTDTQGALLLTLLLVASATARMLARRISAQLSPPERCLVLGDATSASDLHQRTDDRRGISILGAVDPRDVRTFADLCEVIGHFDVERLIIVQSSEVPQHQTLETVRAAKFAGVRVSILPGILGVVGSQVEFDDVFGMTLLGVRRFGLTRSSWVLKRIFDVACTVALLVVVAPLVAICATLVKLDSPGPVLFRQERVGRGGRCFQIIKLRTMVDGADAMRPALAAQNQAGDGLFKMAEDPRITRVGAFLRRTHLDETTQLWNVLRGEMSLVGPRPLVTYEDAQIKGLDRRRLELTPGMTGPWQIMGSHRRIPLAEMVKLDYLYVASWSLWNDVKILVRTVSVVLRRSGV